MTDAPQIRPALRDRQEEPEPAVPSGGARRRLHLRVGPGAEGRQRQHDRPAPSRRRPLATIEDHRSASSQQRAPTLADVVRITTYLRGRARLRPLQQGLQRSTFGDAVLARTTVEARAVINTKIEMDAIVYKPLAAEG